jgi:hypothetical protein
MKPTLKETEQRTNQQAEQPQTALLFAATMYLLSHAAMHNLCLGRVRLVIEHLSMLCGQADIDDTLRSTVSQLREQWIVLHEKLAEQCVAQGLHEASLNPACVLSADDQVH